MDKRLGINDQLWITSDYIGKIEGNTVEPLSWGQRNVVPPNLEKIREAVSAERGIAWWRITHGNSIE